MWVISGAICGYILCFSAIIFRDRHRSRNATHAAAERGSKQHTWVSDSRELAIVVPTHDGDIARAVVSMKRWPTTCSLVTLTRVDLIVYHATITDTESILARVPDEAMVCFRNTKVVSANLTAEVRQERTDHPQMRFENHVSDTRRSMSVCPFLVCSFVGRVSRQTNGGWQFGG